MAIRAQITVSGVSLLVPNPQHSAICLVMPDATNGGALAADGSSLRKHTPVFCYGGPNGQNLRELLRKRVKFVDSVKRPSEITFGNVIDQVRSRTVDFDKFANGLKVRANVLTENPASVVAAQVIIPPASQVDTPYRRSRIYPIGDVLPYPQGLAHSIIFDVEFDVEEKITLQFTDLDDGHTEEVAVAAQNGVVELQFANVDGDARCPEHDDAREYDENWDVDFRWLYSLFDETAVRALPALPVPEILRLEAIPSVACYMGFKPDSFPAIWTV